MLDSGTLNIGSARGLGDRSNVLTINGGVLRGGSTVANNITLNSTLNTLTLANLTLTGVISGNSGVTARSITAATQTILSGSNTYTGATTVAMSDAAAAPVDGRSSLTISGAVGSILNTSGITVRDGGELLLNYNQGSSGLNSRVSTSTPITVQSGFIQTIGTSGQVRQALGTVNAGGLTTVSVTNNGLSPAGTEVTVANLQRSGNATMVFYGPSLGSNAAGSGVLAGNVLLTQINNAAPDLALVGGGGAAGSTTMSILPWALGESSNTITNYAAGSGFVTYGANGVRLLNTTTEYNTSNNFTTVGATENMRITSATVTSPTAATTVNSLFFGLNGATIAGGTNALTITSGALASNVAAATISSPVLFGASGAGEGIVSVVDALAGTTNNLTLSGGFTAASLTKSGHGDLTISTVDPVINGGITINGGEMIVDAVSRLGGASGITVNGSSQAANRAGLAFTHASGTQTLATPITVNAGTVSLSTTTAATLQVNSNISGSGGVIYRNTGANGFIIIGGTNTYTGPTFFSSGTLLFDGNDARLGDNTNPNASFFNHGGGILQLTGDWTTARAFNVSGTAMFDLQTNNATLSGPITGSSGLTKNGTGTLTIDTGTGSTTGLDSSYSGTLTFNAGKLAITNNGALNVASIALTGAAALDFSGALNIDPTNTGNPWRSINALTAGNTSTIVLGASAGAPVDLRVNSSSGAVAAVISGFGKLVKTSTSSLTLGGANTFIGGVEIRGGTLAISSDGNLGDLGNGITIAGGSLNTTATLLTGRAITLGATPQPIISAAATVTLANTINANLSSTLTLNGAISGPGGVSIASAGTVAFGTANTYQGDTQLTAGTLTFTDNNQLGASTSRIRLSGGTLNDIQNTSTVTLNRTVIVTGSTASSTINVINGGTLDLTGPLVGNPSFALLKTGPGTLSFSGDNSSYFGTLQVNGSGVALTSSGQMRRTTVNLNAAGTSFDMSNLTRELNGVATVASSTLALGTSGSLTTGFNNTAVNLQGPITGGASASLIKVGTGNMNLLAANTFGGGVHVLAGRLSLGNATGTLAAQSAFTVGGWGNSTNTGALLSIDSTSAVNNDRIADTQIIHSNASEVIFTTNTGTLTTETIGSLRGAGMTTVTMTTGGALNFADATTGLQRINNGTFLFRAGNGNIGTAAATTAIANLTFGNNVAGDLIGGGGAAGTPTISILPYAVGDSTTGGAGGTFVTYGANGVRLMASLSEYNVQANAAGVAGIASTENFFFNNSALTTTQITGGTDLTVNSLSIAGTASQTRIESAGTEKLIVTSGAVLNRVANVFTTAAVGNTTVGIQLGINVAELQTGNSNARELNVFTTGGDLQIGAKITTSGGLTKSGAANLYLTNNANSYTGTTTINAGSLVVDNLSALGGSTTLQMGGGFLKYRGGDATLTQSVVAAGGETGVNQNGGSAGFHVVSGTTLTAKTSGISGYGGVLKDGTGVLKLTGTNTYSGATIISGGALAIDGAAALGTNNRIIFADGISANGGQTLRFDANNITLTQDIITNTASANIGFGFDTNGNNATLSGPILSTTSARGLYKFGAGNLTLTATEMFTGPTQVFGGTLTLGGANGSILNSTGSGGYFASATVLVAPRSALVLDNSDANNNNRLPDVWDTPFGTGNTVNGALRVANGEFKIIGNAAGTQEKINQFVISFGNVTLQGGGTQLISGAFNMSSFAAAGLVRGTNLGGTPGASSANWFLTDLGSGALGANSPLLGAGGAEGTPFINIVHGFMADTSATGVGTDLLTYAADTGFRPLTASEYTSAIPANNFDPNRAPNIALTGTATVNETTMINAIKLGSGAVLGGSGSVIVQNDSVLATGNAGITTPMLTNTSGSAPALAFLTPGSSTTLTVDSTLNSGRLSKMGDGTLLVNGRHIGGSFIVLGEGTLKLGPNGALNPLIPLINAGTGNFDLGGADRVIGDLPDDNNITAGTFYSGQRGGGTVTLGANRLTLYDSNAMLYTGNITGTGGLTKAFNSTGVSTFTQPQSYTGSTVIRGGSIQLAGGGTLASSSIELRGGSLAFANADDNATSGYIANRIGTSTPITWAGGGITFTENANTPANHSLGATTIAGGDTLTITNGSAAPSTTTFANLIRGSTDRGTLTIAATNLGLAQSPIGNARVFATQINGDVPANALIGGGGAVGSTTQNILPWAWSSTASSFLTYDNTNGFRPLVAAEYATSLPTATATQNVRTSGLQTLTAPTTVNALFVGGNISGAFDLTVTSGALAIGGASPIIGVTTNALLTGAGNTSELIMNNSSGGTLNYNITTSGGVTKYGSSNLTLAGTNTFTGGFAINEGVVGFSSDNQLGAAGGAIRFGGIASSIPSLAYTGSTALAMNRPIETVSIGNFTGVANTRWQFNGIISGAGGVRFTTANALFELNAANTYSGPTQLTNSTVFIKDDSSLGNGGEVLFSGGNLVTRGDWTNSRLIHVTASSSIVTNLGNTTWSGQFIGSSAFAKNGAGNLTLTEAMPYSSTLTVNGGALVLRDRGSLAVGTLTASVNASITLDDRSTHFSDRASDTGTLSLGAGNLNLLGNASTTTEEVINTLALATGANTVTITPGTGQAAILRLATSATSAGAAATLFRGTNLGVNAPGSANTASIVLTSLASQNAVSSIAAASNSFALTGGLAPNDNPSIGIIKGAFGDTSATGLGTQLVTYDLEKGVRLLNPATEYTTTLADGSIVTDNIKADGTAKNLTTTSTIANALWLKDGGSITGGGTLGLSSGSLLVTGTGNSVTGIIATTPNVLAIGGSGDVTFNTTNGIVTTGGLSKMGAGTLTINAATNYTGNTWLHSGTINVGHANAIAGGVAAQSLRFFDGTLVNSSGSPMTIANNVVIDGTMRVGGAQDLTFSGSVSINNATREFNITNTGITTINGAISPLLTNVAYGITKTGPGTLVLTNVSNNYDGPTTINGGELRVGPAGSTGSGPVIVNSTGTLSGTGIINPSLTSGLLSAVSINSGGTIRAGNGTGAGSFTITNAGIPTALAINAGGTLDFRYNGIPNAAAINTGNSRSVGSTSNFIGVVGGLSVDANALFSFNGTFSDFIASNTYSFLLAQDTTTLLDSVNINAFSNFVLTGMTGWTNGVFNLGVKGVANDLFLNLTTNIGSPSVARDNATSSITGGSAGNTGTFGDADGAAQVTVVATKGGLPFGTVTKNNGAGTWSWSATGLTNADAGTVTITATDSSGLTSITTFDVAGAGNASPMITSNGGGATATIDVAENTTAVTDVDATDTDLPAQTITYSKSGTDAALFNIDTSTGVLSFVAAPDFETNAGPFFVTVTATDDGVPPKNATQDLTINVTNKNEMPSFLVGVNQFANGAAGSQSVPGFATAINDGDSTVTQSLTFNVSNDNNALFNVQPAIAADGTLSYTPAGPQGTATVTVSLKDDTSINGDPELTTSTQTFTIRVYSFLVTNTNDSGPGSLRQAVLDANAVPGADTITFSDGTGGTTNFTDSTPDTISLNGQIALASDITIQGTGARKLIVRNVAAASLSSRVFRTLFNTPANVTLRGLTITGGNSFGAGGGISFGPSSGRLVMVDCAVVNNSSGDSYGGGLVLENSNSPHLLVNCLFASNTGTGNGNGGGVNISHATTLVNCTITGNTNTVSGSATAAGGLYLAGGSSMINCTVTDNRLPNSTSAGGIRVAGGNVTLTNTIVAGNNVNGNPDIRTDFGGNYVSGGGNLIGNVGAVTGAFIATNDQAGTSASPISAGLAPLADNGGNTDTHALLTGSTALNAGITAGLPADTFDLDGDLDITEAIPFDQRGTGFTRVYGAAVDIGAYESLPAVPEIAVFDGTSTAPVDERSDDAGITSVGSAVTGTTGATLTFTIQNKGTATLNLGTVTIAGPDASQFSVTQPLSTTLVANTSTTFTATFVPTTRGLKDGIVQIASDDADENPFRINLRGTATGPEIVVFNGASTAPGDERTDNGGTYAFGAVAVPGSSTARTFTIKNTGETTLTLGTVSLGGLDPTEFAVTQPVTTVLAVNATTTFTATFSPTTAGAKTAVINIASDDGDENPFRINVVGNDAAPDIVVGGKDQTITNGDTTPRVEDNTDFGPMFVNGSSVGHFFKITNTGNAALNMTGLTPVTLSDTTNFYVGLQPPSSVNPAGIKAFHIGFDPTSAGVKTCVVTVASDDPDAPSYTFTIQGEGTLPKPVEFVAGGSSRSLVTSEAATDADGNLDGTLFEVMGRGAYLASNGTVGAPGTLRIDVGGVDATNNQGYWKLSPNDTALRRLARRGDAMPGCGGAALDILPTIPVPGMNPDGEVTLLGTLRVNTGLVPVTSQDDTAMWSEAGGNGLQLLAREGDPIADVTSAFIGSFGFGCYATASTGGGNGEAAFTIKMRGSTTDSALMRRSITGPGAGTTTIVARENTTAPGTTEFFGPLNGTLTSAVRMDFFGNIVFGALVKPSNHYGIWTQAVNGPVTKVAVAGDTAPDTGGATFALIDAPSMGDEGYFTFRGVLNKDGDNTANDKNDGIWAGTNIADLSCILRRGDTDTRVGGLPPGGKVGNVWNGFINLAGYGAWRGWVDTAGDGISPYPADTFGIYTNMDRGDMKLLISSGDDAPGFNSAKMFFIDHPVVGGETVDDGFLAFIGTVTGVGVTPGVNDKGLWASHSGEPPVLVLRTGDPMTTSQGVKTIFNIDIPGSNMDIRPWQQTLIDFSGRMVVHVTYMDGSSAEVIIPMFNQLTLPE